MQQNSTLQGLAEGNVRKLNWRLMMSFDKTYLSSVSFFKVGNSGSTIGGPDIIPGTNSVVQEWDKYQYTDYSDRVISIDLTREVDQVSSVTMCFGDIVLNNYDDYFTPEGTSPISSNVLPFRPLRIYEGFGDQLVPVFIGLTDGTPVIDEKAKTVSFHIIDFLFSLIDKTVDEMLFLSNVTTDVAISAVLVAAGLSANQLILDTGFNTLSYFSVARGSKVIDVLKQLVDAEQGRLYMDEQGVIRFKNRQNYSNTNVMNFDAYHNIISAIRTREDSIINVVEISSDVRELSANQSVGQNTTAVRILAGSTATIWVDFSNPVAAVDTPIVGGGTSSYTVNTAADGSGTADTTHVTLSSGTLFSRAYKAVFANSYTTDLYITDLTMWGTPYLVVEPLFVRQTDATSIAKYGERPLQIQNDFFQNESDAESKASIILDQYSTFAAVQQIDIKGTPALQLDDPIQVDIFGRRQNSRIVRIQSSMAGGKYSQNLRLKVFTPRSYFMVGNNGSQVGGTDYLAP